MLGEEALQEVVRGDEGPHLVEPSARGRRATVSRRTGVGFCSVSRAHYHGGFSISSRAFMLYDPLVVAKQYRLGSPADGGAHFRGPLPGSVGRASAGKPARLGQSVTRPPASVRRRGHLPGGGEERPGPAPVSPGPPPWWPRDESLLQLLRRAFQRGPDQLPGCRVEQRRREIRPDRARPPPDTAPNRPGAPRRADALCHVGQRGLRGSGNSLAVEEAAIR